MHKKIVPALMPKSFNRNRLVRQSSAIAIFVLTSAWLTACTSAYMRPASASRADSAAIRRDVEFLASDALEGRLAGTPGNDSAAAYLARRYRSLGLTELAPGYLQPFDALSAQDAHLGRTAPRPTQNV